MLRKSAQLSEDLILLLQCSNEPGCINLDPTHNKDNCSNEGFNCALFEEGETTEDEELNLDSTKGSVGLKCPRVFHNLSSNDKAQRCCV